MILTLAQLQQILPYNHNVAVWVDPLNQLLPEYEINTKNRVAAFLAECAHESTEFTVLEENLNYSASALMAEFPSHFANINVAYQYERQPEKIANRVYAGRNGNGPESSGDGWANRGRGALQLTGKTNYLAFGASIGFLPEDVGPFLVTPAGAVQGSCYYWSTRGSLNSLADSSNIDQISRLINGGDNGLADRHQRFVKILTVLGN